MRIDIGEWQIRSFALDDAPSLACCANNPRVARNLHDTFPHSYTLSDAEAWIGYAMGQGPECNFAIAASNGAIGGIGLRLQDDVHRRSGEIGYWLGEPFWGQGIATAALRAFTEFAFTRFDLVRLYGYVYEGNPASARVMEKGGTCARAVSERASSRRDGSWTSSCTPTSGNDGCPHIGRWTGVRVSPADVAGSLRGSRWQASLPGANPD